MSTEFDFLIIGQGLAGTTLAWQLRWLGQRVAVIDRESPVTSSRVAAGLISPLTGRRLAVSWRYLELWEHAQAFYRRAQQETDQQFFGERPIVWLLDHKTRAALTSDHSRATFVRECPRPPRDQVISDGLNAVEFYPSGRLDVRAFLDASRQVFQADGSYCSADVSTEDVCLQEESIVIPRLGLSAKNLVFCQGIDERANPWFREVVFEPAKGEILTLRIPGFREQRVLHHDVWLAPLGQDLFLAGATFDREAVDARPTEQGRAEVLQKLAAFLHHSPDVIDHQAAFRPIVRGRLPVVGLHRCDRRLGLFNGLGAKGALRAPFVAWQFAHLLVRGAEVSSELRLAPGNGRIETPPAKRLTELAHQHVSEVLDEGDIAIDATAGNGLDTVFLAKRVGQGGRVFAIDIQQDAIERTQANLAAKGLSNVQLCRDSHARLDDLLPLEYHGKVAAMMLNLGYLPRGDKTITTTANATLAAIEAGLRCLKQGGVMTIVAYTGHPGGCEEAKSVEQLLATLPSGMFEIGMPSSPLAAGPPRLYVISKS